jgi:hypothetical protein
VVEKLSVLGSRFEVMSTSTATPPATPPTTAMGTATGGPASGAVSRGPVRDLDASEVLSVVVARRRAADRAEADLLAAVVHFVDLHPVTDDLPTTGLLPPGAVGPPGVPVAGEGTPEIAEHAVEELGAALGVPYRAALRLVGDAVELCFRLPRLWALVQNGRLQAWKARRVAQATLLVSREVAGFVDRHLAVDAARNRVPVNVNPVVHEALLRCDPDTAVGREEAALAHRDVQFDYSWSTDTAATAAMTATLDMLDAIDLDNALTEMAASMRHLGDTDPLGVRRSHALGMLASPQRVLDVFGTDTHPDPTPAPAPGPAAESALGPRLGAPGDVERPTGRVSTTLYVHVTTDDLASATEDRPADGRVETLGAASMQLLKMWLERLGRVTVRPVLDISRSDAVDAHDPPGWMRELVEFRDGHCVFPGCRTDARACDLDHIQPYVPVDDGGPPGQTSPENLAPLCRRHHRLKTFTAWGYHRTQAGDYTWTSPRGQTYAGHPTSKTPTRT